MKSILAALLLAAASATVFAQASPAGTWKTIDDETKQEKSIVRITDNGWNLFCKPGSPLLTFDPTCRL